MANFPYKENKGDKINFNISRAKILIEQSFSQFGDADIVLMIKNNNKKQIVFIEAKVKTFQRNSWEIFKEFNEFDKLRKKSGVVSSNLFIQLFLKVVLAKTLQLPREEEAIAKLQQGIEFPKFSKRNQRKIGENGVVVDAVKECWNYRIEPFFIALLPEKEVKIEKFYNNNLKNSDPLDYYGWDIKKMGFITWEQVENFCNKNKFENTLSCFERNEEQIY